MTICAAAPRVSPCFSPSLNPSPHQTLRAILWRTGFAVRFLTSTVFLLPPPLERSDFITIGPQVPMLFEVHSSPGGNSFLCQLRRYDIFLNAIATYFTPSPPLSRQLICVVFSLPDNEIPLVSPDVYPRIGSVVAITAVLGVLLPFLQAWGSCRVRCRSVPMGLCCVSVCSCKSLIRIGDVPFGRVLGALWYVRRLVCSVRGGVAGPCGLCSLFPWVGTLPSCGSAVRVVNRGVQSGGSCGALLLCACFAV